MDFSCFAALICGFAEWTSAACCLFVVMLTGGELFVIVEEEKEGLFPSNAHQTWE